MRIAICDNEDMLCSYFEHYLLQIANELNREFEINVYYSVKSLCQDLVKEECYDVIFWGIELDDFSDVDVGNFIRDILGYGRMFTYEFYETFEKIYK